MCPITHCVTSIDYYIYLRPRYRHPSIDVFGNILTQRRTSSEKKTLVVALAFFNARQYSACVDNRYVLYILCEMKEQVGHKSLEKFSPLPFMYFEAYSFLFFFLFFLFFIIKEDYLTLFFFSTAFLK